MQVQLAGRVPHTCALRDDENFDIHLREQPHFVSKDRVRLSGMLWE
jgi:hypothetical protein